MALKRVRKFGSVKKAKKVFAKNLIKILTKMCIRDSTYSVSGGRNSSTGND